MGQFCISLFFILDDFGLLWFHFFFKVILGCFGSVWVSLGLFGIVLACFGWFWVVWQVLACFGSLRPFSVFIGEF